MKSSAERPNVSPATDGTGIQRAAAPRHASLVAAMHDDLMPLAESIITDVQLLQGEAEHYPEHYRADLQKLSDAARKLHTFLKDHLAAPSQSPAAEEDQQRLRHDIRNLLSHVAGYTQLLLMEETEELFGAFTTDLERIKEYCDDGEVLLSQYRIDEEAAGSADEHVTRRVDLSITTPLHKPAEPATVLVTDDNERSRELLARVLQRKGHTVFMASSGQEALNILQQQEFDLVLLDFIMPEMNGYQVLQVIKADERLRYTPVIVVSALNTVHEVIACIEIGAEDFLTKPVDVKLLEARVNATLEKKRLREREFGQFFTPELARHFVRHPELLRSGHEAEVSILFCDIRQFSSISERLGPSDTVSWLSDVMETLSDCVIHRRGVLVDYIGDELMAMWGAPEEHADHAVLACQAAVDMLGKMPALSAKWHDIIGAPTRVGIGINTGPARVGNTGSRRKFKYGALGNTVNLASRIQGATKYFGTDLLITGDTLGHCGDCLATRRLCTIRVVNIEKPVELYEIFTDDDDASRDLRHRYEQALLEFERMNFRVAASILGNLVVDFPLDRPSLQLMSRVTDMLLNKPTHFNHIAELKDK